MARWKLPLLAAVLWVAGAAASATSLYNANAYRAYTSDQRQRQVGDLITVMVYETATASASANTTAGRDTAVGWDTSLPGKQYSGGQKTSNLHDGGGQSRREGRLLAQITVRVREISERGELVVSGEQALELNGERQQIRLEGVVRPQDISDGNVVLSTRIADAKISYAGQGTLSDAQRPAWWHRLLTLFGL